MNISFLNLCHLQDSHLNMNYYLVKCITLQLKADENEEFLLNI